MVDQRRNGARSIADPYICPLLCYPLRAPFSARTEEAILAAEPANHRAHRNASAPRDFLKRDLVRRAFPEDLFRRVKNAVRRFGGCFSTTFHAVDPTGWRPHFHVTI